VSGPQKGDVKSVFLKRKRFQIYAIIVTAVLMFSALWKMKHPGLFLGTLSEDMVSWIIIGFIAAFVVFSSFNWRCPACGKHLGSNVSQKRCRKCGVSFI